MAAPFSSETKMRALQRAGYHCECCGVVLERNGRLGTGMPYHIHHRKPQAKGGSSTLMNAAAVCTKCHSHLHRVQDLGYTFPQACDVVRFARRNKISVEKALALMTKRR